MRLLLLSTGGRPLFQHAREELREFLAAHDCRRVGFVTAANLFDEAEYFGRAKAFFDSIDIAATHIRWRRPPAYLDHLDAIVVGGGNTYALLKRLHEFGLLSTIRWAVRGGKPYVGASAGSNIAGPNACTTNDMPIYEQPNLRAMGFVPWNINPHYPMTKADARGGTQFGETRDERIAEYHRVNSNPVVCLEEPAMIRVEDSTATVLGKGRVRLFRRGAEPRWFSPGECLPPARLLTPR